jgi:pimeloyl-ACP methyl ester carboxylesterase
MLDGLGVEVVAPDLPGYGLSVRSRRLQPSYALWTELTHELIEAERATDGVPVVVFGLSLGGLLAYVPAARNRHVAGLVATTLVDARRIIAMATIGRNAVVGAGGATVRLGFLRSLMSVRPAGEPENFDVCPVLLEHPEIDPWTPVELSRPFSSGYPLPRRSRSSRAAATFRWRIREGDSWNLPSGPLWNRSFGRCEGRNHRTPASRDA